MENLDSDYYVVNIKCHAPIRNIRIESIPSTDKGDYTRSSPGTNGTADIKVPKLMTGVSFSVSRVCARASHGEVPFFVD